jgi:hypothetical protein
MKHWLDLDRVSSPGAGLEITWRASAILRCLDVSATCQSVLKHTRPQHPGKAGMPMVLCLVTSMMALPLSVEPYRAGLPWTAGVAIAIISIRERIFERRASEARRSKKHRPGIAARRPRVSASNCWRPR